ncbi:MAG: extra-cytoplasmic solute receptor family protein [Hyphomicrobiales bacterium]|nr:extra-cytoplasmic solute receptor family protein [Hyphomicrobiales bacterium]
MRKMMLAAAAVLGAMLQPAAAQTYPAKSIQLIVPYAAGGVTDVLARALGNRLQESWGQPVVIVNKPGANSQVGAEMAAKSPTDGYTLMVTADTTITANPYLYSKLKYEAADFIPVSGLGISPQALVVHPSVPANTVGELVDYAKKNPDKIFYGTFGSGSSGHLNILSLQERTGATFTPVHYSGASPAITDLLGGHIKMMIVSIGLIAGPWETGALKVLAFGSDKRLDRKPEVPTISESIPGFRAGSWYGLFAPKGTPPDIVEKLSAETRKIYNDPAFQAQFLTPSYTFAIANGPAEFGKLISADAEHWSTIIRAAKVTAE